MKVRVAQIELHNGMLLALGEDGKVYAWEPPEESGVGRWALLPSPENDA